MEHQVWHPSNTKEATFHSFSIPSKTLQPLLTMQAMQRTYRTLRITPTLPIWIWSIHLCPSLTKNCSVNSSSFSQWIRKSWRIGRFVGRTLASHQSFSPSYNLTNESITFWACIISQGRIHYRFIWNVFRKSFQICIISSPRPGSTHRICMK